MRCRLHVHTHEAFAIGRQTLRENPATLPVAALASMRALAWLLAWMLPPIVLQIPSAKPCGRAGGGRDTGSCSTGSADPRIAAVTV